METSKEIKRIRKICKFGDIWFAIDSELHIESNYPKINIVGACRSFEKEVVENGFNQRRENSEFQTIEI